MTPGPAEPEHQNVRAMLEKSKKEGEIRRRRIKTTTSVAGATGIIFGAAAFAMPLSVLGYVRGAVWFGGVPIFSGLAMVLASCVILLLGVLPTEVASIKVANRALSTTAAVVGVMMTLVTTVIWKKGLEGDYWRLERAKFATTLCVWIWISSARFVAASHLSQRERLDKLWRLLSQWLLGLGFLFFAGPALGYFADVAHHGVLPTLYSTSAFITVIGAICGWPNFRMKAQAALSRHGETRMSAAVAAAIGNHSVNDAQEKAAQLLRYVTLDKISEEELAENKPNPLLYERSVAGKFGDVDAFISHSWSDPSEEKWDGLQRWRQRFKKKYGREPRVWFDKCCIDQHNIDDSLLCLPVHLAACKKIIICVGPSYLTRMWCIMEVFTFLAAVNDMARLECMPLQGNWLAAEERTDAQDAVMKSFRTFTVANCTCYSNDTRDKLLSIIEAGCGTLEYFDGLIRNMTLCFTEEDASADAIPPRRPSTSQHQAASDLSTEASKVALGSPSTSPSDVALTRIVPAEDDGPSYAAAAV